MIIGTVAHVDAGKTTLTEGLLFESGQIRKVGRVDKGDAFLDTDSMEKERGITIFSKQAVFSYQGRQITLIDTPGHVDFSAEMERALQILDAALLVISSGDGVTGHTRTVWRLLEQYQIPVLLFINKMDQPQSEKEKLLAEIKKELSDGCVDFSDLSEGLCQAEEATLENIAMCKEQVLEEFLETGIIKEETVRQLIKERRLFPCFFGSALKLEGVRQLLEGICRYVEMPEYGHEFGARVYKIARDEQGNRLTYMKLTGGKLSVKESLSIQNGEEVCEEKVNQIRLYSGSKYELLRQAQAGEVCAVTGLEHTFPGQGLGIEEKNWMPLLEPVLSYQLLLPEGVDAGRELPRLLQLAEEIPELQLSWEEEKRQILVKLMGEVQIQVLQSTIQKRLGLEVGFGPGRIVYKETIGDTVEGVGHFEPLRHYAEVHLILEPLERGSGMQFESSCSEDELDRNWQRLILTHLKERQHRGVLTGSGLMDMKITLAAGRAHIKHTEGGDFRQAVYRAVRQGLMQAESILLEPYYEFCLEVPDTMIGKAMADLDRMCALKSQPEIYDGRAVLRGSAPVVLMQGYQKDVTAYTRGQGRLTCTVKGYDVCHNTQEVLEQTDYDCERDLRNPSSSVFCAHGAGFVVPWDEVREYMHLPSVLEKRTELTEEEIMERARARWQHGDGENDTDVTIGTEEIDAILQKTFYANQKQGFYPHKGISGKRTRQAGYDSAQGSKSTLGNGEGACGSPAKSREYRPKEKKQEYLLVDGYNIIFAWEELRELAKVSLDGARGRLLDILCNYQGVRGCELIAVFDAYRLEGHPEETLDHHNIHVVYTREAETADRYIERFAHENGRKYQVSVATSDGLEQIIIRGAGCSLISARELEEEVKRAGKAVLENYQESQKTEKIYLSDALADAFSRLEQND